MLLLADREVGPEGRPFNPPHIKRTEVRAMEGRWCYTSRILAGFLSKGFIRFWDFQSVLLHYWEKSWCLVTPCLHTFAELHPHTHLLSYMYYHGQKKRAIVVMNHVILKNLQSDFAAIASMREVVAVASRVRSWFRSWIKHPDSSISQDSDLMHQQHGSFFFLSRVVLTDVECYLVTHQPPVPTDCQTKLVFSFCDATEDPDRKPAMASKAISLVCFLCIKCSLFTISRSYQTHSMTSFLVSSTSPPVLPATTMSQNRRERSENKNC